MRVICAGEMLVDIFVRPVQQIPLPSWATKSPT